MKFYEVGGCVRDRILGMNPKDIDYVVVDSNAEHMLSLGFEQVGASFPVFLHPETKDEYALARKEIKNGSGYLGFLTQTVNVTLEEDLFRRDLTINAMAMDTDGKIIDPFNGQRDLENGILRHVSDHFQEDPVRLLRIARFSARYNFNIATSTNEMLTKMVKCGEIDNLQGERIWLEVEKTLSEKNIEKFFEALTNCNACIKIFPFSKFPNIEKFNSENTPRDNLLIIFSLLNKKELDNWKIPAHEKEMITSYKLFFNQGKGYTQMDSSERILFIKSVKALHKDAQDPELVKNIFSHIKKFKNNSINVDDEVNALNSDVQKLRSYPFEEILKEYKLSFPSANIGEFMKNQFINAISSNHIVKKPKI